MLENWRWTVNNGNDLLSEVLSGRQRPFSPPPPQTSFSNLLSTIVATQIKPIPPVKAAFDRLKTNLELNSSFQETITQNHTSVRQSLEKFGLKTKLIGSLQRETRTQPRTGDKFDIDILVVMGEFYGWTNPGYGISTTQATGTVKSLLSENKTYRDMNPKQDDPTVLFKYENGVKVELVPAYLDKVGYSYNGASHTPLGRAYWIPKNGDWVLADYDYEAAYISVRNQQSGGLLIPTIKMLKAIKRNYFPELSSIHIEILAADIIPWRISFRKALGMEVSYPSLIRDFFEQATAERILAPKQLPGSLTPHIELDLLTSIGLPKAFFTIRDFIKDISLLKENDQLKYWKTLFGEPFTLE